ncbi:MAG TPA: helix-turn-helix transcriptional regulator [Streptosporangiaceae bacterium]|jgi:transcriptional regulator with XRE-family HTH domain
MGNEASPSPVVQRRRLRAELRAARQAAGLTQDQAAKAVDWSLSKIIRIEAGSVGISTVDLKALLSLYGIDRPDRTDQLVALAKAARERGWWSKYSEFLTTENQRELLQLIGYESAASIVRNFETLLIPGLLQTEEYAHAVTRQFAEKPSDGHNEDGESPNGEAEGRDRAERERRERENKLVEIRMKRQEHLLDSPEPPLMFFILDEAVVRREVDGKAAMGRQIRWLIELANRPYLTIEIVPFSQGAYPGLRGPFVVLEFPDAADDDVVYLESPRGDLIRREESEQVLPYREAFEQLRESSLGPEATKTFLADIAKEMT